MRSIVFIANPVIFNAMRVNKIGGRVYGATLTKTEEKALNMEIQRQLAEYDKKHEKEVVALILWALHEQFGFGEERLHRFYKSFDENVNALLKRYELPNSDDIWLCTRMLKEYGIDLKQWERDEDNGH